MIGFDNGPANGDYVRYIDGLMARAARQTSAAVLTDSGVPPVRRRAEADLVTSAPRARAPADRPVATGRAGPTGRPAASGFVPAGPESAASRSAAAIASALMSGRVDRRALLASASVPAFAMMTLGLVLLIVGLLWSPLGLLGIAGGASLLWAGVKRLRPVVRAVDGPAGR